MELAAASADAQDFVAQVTEALAVVQQLQDGFNVALADQLRWTAILYLFGLLAVVGSLATIGLAGGLT